jgi:dipeptidyl aminopeptidase/acylaminoacyl peptidase
MTRSLKILGVILLAALTAHGQTATRRPMTFADMMAMKRVSDPQISPSGKWVMFSVTDVSLEKNAKLNHLWIVPLAGGQERQITIGKTNDSYDETNGRFSPDGKWVMFSKQERIWYAPFDDAAGTLGREQEITTFNGGDNAIWAPDSKHILFSMDVYPECESHAPAGPKRNDEEMQCNLTKDRDATQNPVKAQIFTSLLYRHWNSYVGPKRSHIFYMAVPNFDVPPGDARSLVPYEMPTDLTPASVIGDHVAPTFSLGGPLGYAISPDGKEVAYVVNLDPDPSSSTNNDVFTLRLDEPGAKAVKISTSPGSDDGPAYSPDGKYLAFRSQARAGFESDQFKLVLMDRISRALEPVDMHLLNPPTERFTGWVDEFVWSPDGAAIVFASGIEGEEAAFVVDIHTGTMGGHPTFGRETLHGEYGDLRLVNVEHSEMHSEGLRKLLPTTTLVATRMTIDQPAEIVTAPLGAIGHTMYTGPPSTEKILSASKDNDTFLTHLNDSSISQLDLTKMDSYWFAGAEGTKVQGFIIRPPNFDPSKKYPVKFLLHGGPQTAWGDSWSYRWNWQLMAASGYVVIGINRRGSTGYGQKFVDEVSGDWGGKAYIDLMRGLDAAEAKFPFIDKTRECALGASYGGYMADWVLTHTNRFKCIVTHDGMYDAESAYGSTEEMWFNEWEFRRGPATGAAAWDPKPAQPWRYQDLPADQDPFRKWSPMRYIQNAKTPTLVIHSQRDYRLDVSQGFELFTALQRLNVPSKFLYFPDEGHWVLKPQNSSLWYDTVSDWCDRWTKTGKYAETK